MATVLRCSICRSKFPWDVTKGYPKFCPECGETIGHDRADDDIVMPFVRSARTKATDDVYRQMETTSEYRMHAAAAMAGTSADEMSGLKITNLNDRRDAEVAAMPVENAVTQQMETANARGGTFGFQGSAAAAAFAAGTSSGAVTVNGQTTQGIAPRAGATAMSKLQRAMGK